MYPNPNELALWLEGNDPKTIIRPLGKVSQWIDKSPNGRNPSNSTEATQPSYDPLRKGVKFTAANQTILISSNFINTTGPFSVSILLTENGTANTQEPFYNGDSGANGWGFLNNWAGDPGKMQGLYGAVAILQANAPRVTGRPISQVLIRSASANLFFLEDTLYSVSNTAPATPSRAVTVGGAYGNYPSLGSYYDGWVHSIIVQQKVWSTAERQRIQGYQYWAYGAQQYLPETHPYRFSPPKDNRLLKRRTRTIVSLAGAAGSSGGGTNDNVTTQDVGMAWSVDAMTVAQDHVLSAQDTAFALTVDPVSIAQDNVLTAQDVAFALEVGSMAVAQDHVLTPQNIAFAFEVGAVTVAQDHVLTAQNVSLAFDVDTMALSSATDDSVTAQDVAFALSVGSMTVAQDHALSAQDVSLAFSVGPITIAQDHVISAPDVSLSWGVEALTVAQDHVLGVQDVGLAWTVGAFLVPEQGVIKLASRLMLYSAIHEITMKGTKCP